METKDNRTGQVVKQQTRGRSPAYPAFPLEGAIARTRKLWDVQRKTAGHVDSVLAALGYNTRSGAAMRALAALNHYGMTEEKGAGDDRRISITALGQDIIHLNEADPRRITAMKEAALKPQIHATLWERYGKLLPTDDSLRSYLVRDLDFNDSAVSDVIKNYRETFAIAKLGDLSDRNPVSAVNKHQDSGGYEPPAKDNPMTITEQQELPVLVGNGRIARIPFPMSQDDFDLLIETLNVWKKRIIKKSVAFPIAAMWSNKDFQKGVTLIGIMGEKDGVTYYQSEDGTGIPASELIFAKRPPK